MPSFAEQLTAARKAAGMTQEELSAAVHVARNTISNWEHGRTEPDLDTLRQLGQILHTDFLNSAAAPAEQEQAPQPEGSGTASGGDAPARKPDKKKLLALCAAALVVVAVAAGLLISRSIRMSKTAEVTLSVLHDPALPPVACCGALRGNTSAASHNFLADPGVDLLAGHAGLHVLS